MLRVALEIDGKQAHSWNVDANDYVVNTTTATETYFDSGREHAYLLDGTRDYNYSGAQINNNALDCCTACVDSSGNTYPMASVSTAGATVGLVTSGWMTTTAYKTVIYCQAPIVSQYSFGIQLGYTDD